LLGGHVIGGADDGSWQPRAVGPGLQQLGDAEVEQLYPVSPAPVDHEDVVRLDVAVHHAGGVRRLQRLADLGDDLHGTVQMEGPLAEEGAQGPTLEQLHDAEGPLQSLCSSLLTHVQHPDDVRVAHAAHCSGFAKEAVQQGAGFEVFLAEQLEGHLVAISLGPKNAPHGSFSEEAEDAVRPDGLRRALLASSGGRNRRRAGNVPGLPHGICIPASSQGPGQRRRRGEGKRVVQRGATTQHLAESAGTGEPAEQVEEEAAESAQVEPAPRLAGSGPGHRSRRLEGSEAGAGQTQRVSQHHRGVQMAVGQAAGGQRIERWGQRLGHCHHVLGARGRLQLDQKWVGRFLADDIDPAVDQLTCIFDWHDGGVRRMDQSPSFVQAPGQRPCVGDVCWVQQTQNPGALVRTTDQEGVGHPATAQAALHLPGAGGPTLQRA
jgi:hypothetical protein